MESEANFVGETGYHGGPELKSIEKFIERDFIWPEPNCWKDNEQWLTHCTAPQEKDSAFSYRIELMANQVKELFACLL